MLALGMDRRWRGRAASVFDLPAGSVVLDVGCGTGGFYREILRRGMDPVGFDLSEGMLRAGLTSGALTCAVADALHLPVPRSSADGLSISFALRDVGEPARLLAEAYRVLRPGGQLVLLDVAQPSGVWARAAHRFYFARVAPAIGGLLSDREAYRRFGESMSLLPSETELAGLLAGIGFDGYRRRTLDLGSVQLVTARRGGG